MSRASSKGQHSKHSTLNRNVTQVVNFVLFVVNLVEVLEWWLNKVDVNIIDLNRDNFRRQYTILLSAKRIFSFIKYNYFVYLLVSLILI